MAAYSYKDVCYNIPQIYEERFEGKHCCEFDANANYDGDYWIVTGEYIEDLEKRIKQYQALENLDGGEAIEKLLELNKKQVWE